MKRALILVITTLAAGLMATLGGFAAGASPVASLGASVTAPATQGIRDAGCHTYHVSVQAQPSFLTVYQVTLSRNGDTDYPDGVWVTLYRYGGGSSFNVPNLMLCGARAARYTVKVSAVTYSSDVRGYLDADGNTCDPLTTTGACNYFGGHVQTGYFSMTTHTQLRKGNR